MCIPSISSSFEILGAMLFQISVIPPSLAMLSTLIFLLCFPSTVVPFTLFNRLQLPSSITGPESLAFDSKGEGPYTGVSDGRVLKYQGPDVGFTDFSVTSPNRSKEMCDGSIDASAGGSCGRPLGLGFNYQTGDLYMADAYLGLMVVGSRGGIAARLVAAAEGTPFRFLAGLDVDQRNGMVYFTEASTRFQLGDMQDMIASNDSTGRLLRYDPGSREVRVLLGGLSVAVGVSLSSDGTFVLVAELSARRIRRFWLGGPRANTSEVFMELLGSPGNIKRNDRGEFWVAMNNALGPPAAPPESVFMPLGLRLSEDGGVLEVAPLVGASEIGEITEVQERNGELYVASLVAAYAGIYRP